MPSVPIDRRSLPNGLRVVLSRDPRAPVVAVNLWYAVGSKNEKTGKTGFAHLFEHMMFQGSAHVADKMHFKYIQEAGGSANGSTNTDRTNYFETLPSNFLETGLWLESDRMGYLLATLTKEKLDNQRDVVRNEKRQNYDNRPYGMAPKAIMENVYPPSHPWSGFALILMAISILLVSRLTQVAFPWWALSATVVLAAGLWTFAAMHS